MNSLTPKAMKQEFSQFATSFVNNEHLTAVELQNMFKIAKEKEFIQRRDYVRVNFENLQKTLNHVQQRLIPVVPINQSSKKDNKKKNFKR
jgi:hypothetical protein